MRKIWPALTAKRKTLGTFSNRACVCTNICSTTTVPGSISRILAMTYCWYRLVLTATTTQWTRHASNGGSLGQLEFGSCHSVITCDQIISGDQGYQKRLFIQTSAHVNAGLVSAVLLNPELALIINKIRSQIHNWIGHTKKARGSILIRLAPSHRESSIQSVKTSRNRQPQKSHNRDKRSSQQNQNPFDCMCSSRSGPFTTVGNVGRG